MIKLFTVYNTRGEILRSGTCPPALLELQAGSDELVLEGSSNDVTQWVETIEFPGVPPWPVIVDKEEMPYEIDRTEVPADDLTPIIISGLPPNTTLTIDNDSYPVEGGTIEITFDTEKIYPIKLEAFPYLPTSFEVAAL